MQMNVLISWFCYAFGWVVAGQTILPSILDGFSHIVNASDPLKFVYQAVSYKPLISLFNMTGVAQTNPELAGIGRIFFFFSLTFQDNIY